MINRATQSSLLVAALLGVSVIAVAETPNPEGYLTDTRGAVVKSGTGLCWRTARWTPAMAIAECDPDLVKKEEPAAKPAEPKKAEPMPTKPTFEKVTLAADALFDFDKAVLRPEGKAKLDDVSAKVKDIKLEVIIAVGHADRFGTDKYNQKLSEKRAEGKAKLDDVVAKAKDIKLEVIIAVGHADRFGTDAYNQKLSERRANAVKDYLVSKGVDANRVYSEGKGKTQPKTAPDECKGKKSKKVIACLQPDRRVEIEVIGTKQP